MRGRVIRIVVGFVIVSMILNVAGSVIEIVLMIWIGIVSGIAVGIRI